MGAKGFLKNRKIELGVHFTTRFVTVDERGILEPEKVILVMDDDLFW